MEIPKQVEEAAEMAEEILAGLNPDEKTEDIEETPEEEAPETEETAEEEPEEEEEVAEEEEEPPADSFEQKYRTLQSKYDKEVPRLHQELKDLKQSVIDRLGEFKKEEPKVDPVPEPVNEKLARYKEEYGDELYDFMKEILLTEGKSLFAQTTKPIEEKVSSIEDTQVRAARKAFNDVLTSSVNGDWQALLDGQDPAFAEFLGQKGPFGLMTYAEMFQQANDNWNADAMAEIFNHYLGQNAPAEKPESKPDPKLQKQMDALIAPSRSTTTKTPKTEEKRIWTMETIKEFQVQDRKGKYKPEESKAMWDDLLAAAAEGRIQ